MVSLQAVKGSVYQTDFIKVVKVLVFKDEPKPFLQKILKYYAT